MRHSRAYMKHVMEAADDAPLLYFGSPYSIQTYSTVKTWFVKVTEKTLLLCSFPTAIIIILLLVEPKDWPIGEQIAFCFVPFMVGMPFAWIFTFIQGYLLPKRVKRIFNEISEAAFIGFEKKELDPGYTQLLSHNEEWHLEFYQINNRNMIALLAIFKPRIDDQELDETILEEQFKSFCEKRCAMLKNKSLAQYVNVYPYHIRVNLPMKLKLTTPDYRNLYHDLKAFVDSINCEIVLVESYSASKL